jgi:lysophospholipase L1-like esterase
VTPNDAFLTTNYHDAYLEQVDDIVQPLYAATLGGSFHPNALGHAALADSVLIELRKVLGAFED